MLQCEPLGARTTIPPRMAGALAEFILVGAYTQTLTLGIITAH